MRSLAKPDGVNEDELERRENIIYLKGSDTPYTGKSFSLDKKGTGHETNYKDGKLEGPNIWWVDGKKGLESNYKGGFRHGLTVGWHENGQKAKKINYKIDRKVEGSAKFWNKKGEVVNSLEEAYEGFIPNPDLL